MESLSVDRALLRGVTAGRPDHVWTWGSTEGLHALGPEADGARDSTRYTWYAAG